LDWPHIFNKTVCLHRLGLSAFKERKNMTYNTIINVISILEDILNDKNNRNDKVMNFSTEVGVHGKQYSKYINLLAYDMDFYDQDPEEQKKYKYFGDEKLEKMIKEALIVLNKEKNELENKSACPPKCLTLES
jgi:hypothetical protein